jgi:hypothetical protein
LTITLIFVYNEIIVIVTTASRVSLLTLGYKTVINILLFILIGASSCLNSFRAWWTWRTIWCTYGRLFYWCRLDWIILQAGKTYERDTFSGRVITTIGRGRQE